MSEDAKRKTKPAPKLTAVELMATPKHMRAWLRTFKPRGVVTRNLCDSTACLGANFLKAKGHIVAFGVNDFAGGKPVPDWFLETFFDDKLPAYGSITAAQALAAIKRAVKASS